MTLPRTLAWVLGGFALSHHPMFQPANSSTMGFRPPPSGGEVFPLLKPRATSVSALTNSCQESVMIGLSRLGPKARWCLPGFPGGLSLDSSPPPGGGASHMERPWWVFQLTAGEDHQTSEGWPSGALPCSKPPRLLPVPIPDPETRRGNEGSLPGGARSGGVCQAEVDN